MIRKSVISVVSTVLLLIVFLSGCDESFNPFQENDQYYFSIFGFLDASADTQWVRVMPVRESLLLDPVPIDATVTLEHIGGASVVLNDSLVSFDHEAYAWNYWTTMDIEPSEAYRITVQRSDGKSSYVDVSIPEDFPTPTVRIDRDRFGVPQNTLIVIDRAVRKLADVQTVYTSIDGQAMYPLPHLQDSVRSSSGSVQVVIDPDDDIIPLNTFFPLPPGVDRSNYIDSEEMHQQIFIASASIEYPYFSSIDEKVSVLPDGISNVFNGVGYVAGIVSKTVPYKTCTVEGTTNVIPCETEPSPW